MLPARRKVVRTVLLGVAVTVVAFIAARWVRGVYFDAPITFSGETGMRYWEVARTSYARGQGFPTWDRSVCGGTPYLGNPESPVLSALVAGLFGVHGDVLDRWYPTVACALSILGTYLWGRRAIGLGPIPALFAGVVVIASGFISLQISARMFYVPFVWIPWVLYFARVGERDVRAAAATGVVIAVMVLEGGLVPALHAILALLMVTLPRMFNVKEAGPWPITRLLGIAAVFFVLFSGVKLFPVLVQLERWPRPLDEHDALKWTELLPMLIDRERFDGLAGHRYHFNEYRAYVGPMITGMAIAGAGSALILKPRRWWLFAFMLFALLLTRGRYSETSPYALITKLPVFNQLEVPSRLVVIASIAIAGCAAVALDAAMKASKNKWLAGLLVAIAAVGLNDVVGEGKKIEKAQSGDPWLPRPDPPARPYSIVSGDDFARNATYPARNVGAIGCIHVINRPDAVGLQPGDHAQAWVDGADVGTVAAANVTQNAYQLHVTMARAGVVHIDQAWDPDWTSSAGTVRRGPTGLIDVALPAGAQVIDVAYRARGATSGFVATMVAALAMVLLLLAPALRRRRAIARATALPKIAPPAGTPA